MKEKIFSVTDVFRWWPLRTKQRQSLETIPNYFFVIDETLGNFCTRNALQWASQIDGQRITWFYNFKLTLSDFDCKSWRISYSFWRISFFWYIGIPANSRAFIYFTISLLLFRDEIQWKWKIGLLRRRLDLLGWEGFVFWLWFRLWSSKTQKLQRPETSVSHCTLCDLWSP